MNTLYYETEGLKSTGIIYGEVEIPENVISLNAVRKKRRNIFTIYYNI